MEILLAKFQVAPREIARHILANRNRALLAVHHLERAVLLLRPVHDVQRKTTHHGADHRVAVLLLVDELTLVLGTYVEPSAIPRNATLGIVHVILHQLANRNLLQFNPHNTLSDYCTHVNF